MKKIFDSFDHDVLDQTELLHPDVAQIIQPLLGMIHWNA